MAIVEHGEYKGRPMLILKRSEDDKFPFQFGVGKAELILQALEDIQEFVEQYGEAAS